MAASRDPSQAHVTGESGKGPQADAFVPAEGSGSGPRFVGTLGDFLYPTPARRTVPAIVGWWERRRLAYNAFVGAAGMFSVATGFVVGVLPVNGPYFPVPLGPIVVFAVMANLCYLLGPATEILIHKLFGREVLPTGPALYRMGLTFSVGLALLPALLLVIATVARVVLGIL